MIIASRIPTITDQMLANTLRAAASSAGADWLTLAEIEQLERRLQASLERLGYRAAIELRAA